MKYFKFMILLIVTLFISSNLYAIGKVHFPQPKSVNPVKVPDQPGLWRVYSSANTNGFGVLGPDTATTNVYLKPTEEAPDTGDNYIRLGTAEIQTVDGVSSTVIPFTYEVLPTGGSGSISVNSSVVNDPNLISTADITISNNAGSVSCLVNSLALSKIAASSVTVTSEIEAAGDTVLDDTTVLTAGATYALVAQILGLPNLVISSPTNNTWINSSTTAFTGTASDDGTVSLIEWKLETGGTYANVTGTTSWSQAGSLGSDGTNKTAYFRATDNEGNQIVKSVGFNLDTVSPVIGTVTPSITTHDGTGTSVNLTLASLVEANELNRQYSIYNVTDSIIVGSWVTFTGLSVTGIVLPAAQKTYRIDVRVTDLAGNTDTESSVNIVYSIGVACIGTFPTDQENFESTTVGSFCTSGLTEVDTNSILNINSTDSAITGTRAMKITMSAVNQKAYVQHTETTSDGSWSQVFGFKTPVGTPAADITIFEAAATAFNSGIRCRITYNSSREISSIGATTGNITTALTADTWYWIGVSYTSSGTGNIKIYSNNAGVVGSVVGSTTFTCSVDNIKSWSYGAVAETSSSQATYYLDAILLDLTGGVLP